MNKPAYFSILTAAVRYDKNLCANAKLLYSEITALTQVEGYCWASNKYFSELYEVDISTIKRWISDLEAHGHIEIFTKKNGMKWDRKIYPKNVYEGLKMSPSKAQKEDYRRLKNEPITIQDNNNTRNNNKQAPNQPTPKEQTPDNFVVVSFLSSLSEKLAKRSIEILSSFSLDQIKRGVEVARQVENPVSFDATLITAVREGWKPRESDEELKQANLKYFEYCKKQDGKKIGSYKVTALNDRIIFESGIAVVRSVEFLVNDKKFESKVKKFLKEIKVKSQ